IPLEIEGLLIAGRCISASHEAQASLRVAAPCMAMGQAAGTAAAMAIDGSVRVTDLNCEHLQERLLQQGAIIHKRGSKIA
ncbi:MAG: FAD-dependent oxidoreductase, partial [Alphaproteobacteria bacterium]|nr:FAD-dependent oxidoreductase [Alphaproteobacteria bacterium]